MGGWVGGGLYVSVRVGGGGGGGGGGDREIDWGGGGGGGVNWTRDRTIIDQSRNFRIKLSKRR